MEKEEAVLEIDRSQNCNGCKACCTLSQENSGLMIARLKNTLDVKEGDRVEIDISSSQILLANAIVFLLPVIDLIAGYIVGAYLLAPVIKTSPQPTGIVCGAVLFALSFFIVKYIEEKQQAFFKPQMVKKIRN